ncbi:Alanine dehydrogenase [Cryobacterium psychrotolerans]|uniref:Alanine dehydrogenase n=2 Tax=Cryobacterium psychrotolerans TaxID=386301 RepID=A0A1G8YVN4_9MICO|nr:alanine dehydrogenase [Cryobacterium psychrotolerans]SDK06833.1 Alanine dehydrogenase [Cryobacterium psychrotolerans]
MGRLTLGIMSRSRKPDERRLPIHPLHFDRIDPEVRARMFLESGYGEDFGVSDEQLAPLVAGLRSRDELIAECDVILLAKPLLADVEQLREGQTLWGWPHCVQDAALTQLAIDKRLTLIAFEAMNHWTASGQFNLHVLHKNNELAGYCSVLHSLQLIGSTGDYGRKLRAAVIGFGATARGAVTALNAHGIYDVSILTNREISAVSSPIHSAQIVQLGQSDDGPEHFALVEEGRVPVPEFLAGHDIIVNCVLQDPNAPLTFLSEADLPTLAPGSLIVDVSCDEGMGFSWARPTSFREPTFTVGNHVTYYAVDHSPSYLWNSATWEISEALLPYLEDVLAGEDAWQANETLRRAIEISDGVIQNPSILAFQGRTPDYPHPRAD